jgi:integrase
MPSLKYVLRDPNIKKESLLYLIVRFNSKQYKFSLGKNLKIIPVFWDKENQCAIIKNSHPQLVRDKIKVTQEDFEKVYKPFNIELNRCKENIAKILNNLNYNKIDFTKETFTAEFNKVYRIHDSIIGSLNLNEFIERFIHEIENGDRKIQKSGTQKKYEFSTVKKFKATETQFKYYQKDKNKKFDFNDIDILFYHDFVDFFQRKNYSPNTIGKHFKCLKTILKHAYEEGYHKNLFFNDRSFETPSVESDQIYLTENEIELIRKLDLSKMKDYDEARDVFLIGCYTGLRYSDFSRITREHIQTLETGKQSINIITKKTGERVIIPLRYEAVEILKKYNYILPKSYEQKVNKCIKAIGQLAGIKEKITLEKLKGGKKVIEIFEKHKLIVTHTARRSAATNMYLAGIPSYDIMKITGHRTEQNFLKYLRISKTENAERLSSHPYFNNHLK